MGMTARIVIRALIVMVLALAAVIVLTFEIVTVWGRAEVDRIARDEADRVIAIFSDQVQSSIQAGDELNASSLVVLARSSMASYAGGPSHLALLTVGDTRLRSDTGPAALVALANAGRLPEPTPGVLRTVASDAGSLRSIDTAVTDQNDNTLAIVSVLVPQDETRSAAQIVLIGSIGAGLVGLLIIGTVLPLVIRRSLRPLKEVTEAAEDISLADLSARVPVPNTSDEVAELAAKFNRMLERIAEDDETRRRYLAAISHEVRTPLAIAEGHLEVWESLGPTDGQTTVELVADVRRELERLRRVLDDLLAVARGAENIAVRSEPIFLPDLIDALRTRTVGLGHKHVTLEAPPPDVVQGDQDRIEQTLLNLLRNAVEHNPPETTVTLTTTVENDHIVFKVQDDGPGIPEDLRARVFEPFVSSRRVSDDRVSGLGLAVVESLTQAQGGSVELDTGSRGTSIRVRLPRARA